MSLQIIGHVENGTGHGIQPPVKIVWDVPEMTPLVGKKMGLTLEAHWNPLELIGVHPSWRWT